MSYCTQSDLESRFGVEELIQLTDRDNNNSIIAVVVDQAIADAASEIDGYVLAAGYSLPLVNVPVILRTYACDIARYRMYDDHAPEQVTKRYEDALRFLRLLSRGEVSLGAKQPGGEPHSAGEVQLENNANSTFGGGF